MMTPAEHFAALRTPDDCACAWCDAKRETGEFPPAGTVAARRPFVRSYDDVPRFGAWSGIDSDNPPH